MSQQPTGPFAQYLTQPLQPQTPQPSGFETTPVAIAAIGSKFLDGLRAGRLHKAAMAEQENEKTQRAYEQALHFIDKQEGVDPAVKQQHLNQISQAYLSHIAGQKESSKDTGHPMTDMVKNIATNLVGGQMPKAKGGLDMTLIGNAYHAMQDPVNQVQNRSAQIEQGLRDAIKNGNLLTQEQVMGSPAYIQSRQQMAQLHGKPDFQFGFLDLMPKTNADFQRKQLEERALGSVIARRYPNTATPPGVQTSQQAQQLGAAVEGGGQSTVEQPVSSQPIPAPTGAPVKPGQGNLFTTVSEAAREAALLAQDSQIAKVQLAGDPDGVPKLGNSESMVTSDGKRFNGVRLPMDWKGYRAGTYDESTGQRVEGALPANRVDPTKPQPLSQEQQKQLFTSLSGEIDKAIPDVKLATAAKAAIQSQIASGDPKGAGDIITRYQQIHATQQNSRESRALTSALAAQNNGIRRDIAGFTVGQQFNTSEPVKKMRVIDEYTNNVNDAYKALKSGGDPGIYDLEIMRAWAKITDPLTGVREGEYRDIAGIQGPIRDFNVKLNQLFDNNGGRLDDKARDTIVSAINRIHANQYETQFKPYYDQFSGAMDKSKIGGTGIVSDPYAGKIKSKSANPANPAPAIRPDAPGRRRGGATQQPPAAVTRQAPKIAVPSM